VLRYVLSALLKMLHPFMPFITEALYENLPGNEGKSCMLSAWPAFDKTLVHEKGEAQMQGIMEVIRAVRNLRAELKVQPGHKARLMLRPEAGWEEVLREAEPFFLRLAGASSLTIVYDTDDLPPKLVTAVCPAAEVMIPLGDLVDLDKERARLIKERDNTASEIARAQGKLANQGFLNKAPAALVEAERAKLEELERMLVKLDERLAGLAD
jgi:valyl-tRNA synthetase